MEKILIIGPAHPFRGGIAKTNEILAQELNKSGYSTSIFTFTLQYPKFLFPGKTQLTDSEAPLNLNIQRKINSVNLFNWIHVGRQIKKIKPDLLIFRYWLPFMAPAFGTIAKICRKNKHTKVIGMADNIIPHEKRPGDKILTNYFVKNVDGFLTLSNIVLEEINQFDKKKPKTYSPHPIFNTYGDSITKKQAIENLKLDPNYKYVLFFGLIRDYKGLDLLIEAFANEEFQKLKVRLVVAGEFYGDQEKYEVLIQNLKLENEIIIHPKFIPDNEVVNYFCACDIIAQPYKTATQSGVTQVGYHFEKPMLVTNVGGLSEIIPHEKAGYAVDPNSEEIAKHLISFFKENKEEEFIAFVKTEKLKYSWKNLIHSIEELYKKL